MASKMHGKNDFSSGQFGGRTGCFRELMVLFDRMIELKDVGFN